MKRMRFGVCEYCGQPWAARYAKRFCDHACSARARDGVPIGETVEQMFARRTVPGPGGCLLWDQVATKPRQYGNLEHDGRMISAHRFSYQTFVGPIPAGMHICHRCDVPACANPEHLFLGTAGDNMADKCAKGRQPKGEQIHAAKLTEAQVIAIRADTRLPRIIAPEYGVNPQTIREVQKGGDWRHLPLSRPYRRHNAKLTAEQVAAIRADPRLHREIAADYGVHFGTVSEIKRGTKWTRTMTGPPEHRYRTRRPT